MKKKSAGRHHRRPAARAGHFLQFCLTVQAYSFCLTVLVVPHAPADLPVWEFADSDRVHPDEPRQE
jgi:hypothetical protein